MRVLKKVPVQKIVADVKYDVVADVENCCVNVKTTTAPVFTAMVSLTSTLHRESTAGRI